MERFHCCLIVWQPALHKFRNSRAVLVSQQHKGSASEGRQIQTVNLSDPTSTCELEGVLF